MARLNAKAAGEKGPMQVSEWEREREKSITQQYMTSYTLLTDWLEIPWLTDCRVLVVKVVVRGSVVLLLILLTLDCWLFFVTLYVFIGARRASVVVMGAVMHPLQQQHATNDDKKQSKGNGTICICLLKNCHLSIEESWILIYIYKWYPQALRFRISRQNSAGRFVVKIKNFGVKIRDVFVLSNEWFCTETCADVFVFGQVVEFSEVMMKYGLPLDIVMKFAESSTERHKISSVGGVKDQVIMLSKEEWHHMNYWDWVEMPSLTDCWCTLDNQILNEISPRHAHIQKVMKEGWLDVEGEILMNSGVIKHELLHYKWRIVCILNIAGDSKKRWDRRWFAIRGTSLCLYDKHDSKVRKE